MGERVAAVDIGTNTVLLLVAERRADGEIVALEERAEITRLGKGVDRTHRLDEQAVERTLAVLDDYRVRAQELGATTIAAVATSASRDAENGAEFRERAARTLGGAIDVISGPREAALTFAGALGGLGLDATSSAAVIDVGGGSTEIAVGRVDGSCIDWSHSFDVGSVRLTERCVRGDPPTAGELRDLEREARASFSSREVPPCPDGLAVAIAGTATTYAAIDQGLVRYADAPPHGHRMSVDRLRAWVERLAALPLAERREVVGLDPRRADVIVAGGIVLLAAAASLSAETLCVSDRGVRWGLALELLRARP
jgi:exopolyphosphatase/guanosine-5'-triphosphate,3'-diphosphate pyrophosphatase